METWTFRIPILSVQAEAPRFRGSVSEASRRHCNTSRLRSSQRQPEFHEQFHKRAVMAGAARKIPVEGAFQGWKPLDADRAEARGPVLIAP